MSNAPLMPKATAIWLVENTSLTFDQIARFCKLHPLEVKGIADGEVGAGIRGADPITSGQLTRDEIARAEKDSGYDLKLATSKVVLPPVKRRGPRYTPLSRRQDRPNAILWLVRNHPELKDAQISRLVGTTKATIEQIRNRTHWNSANLVPTDPVGIGLCTQIDLDFEVQKAAKNLPPQEPVGDTLLPATATENLQTPASLGAGARPAAKEEEELDAAAVFAKLTSLKKQDTEEDEQGKE